MNTNENVSQSHRVRERLSDDLKRLVEDAESLIAAARHDGSGQMSELRERLECGIREAREQLSGTQQAILERARQNAQRTNEWVHHYPWSSMSAAAGAGLLIGLLLARR